MIHTRRESKLALTHATIVTKIVYVSFQKKISTVHNRKKTGGKFKLKSQIKQFGKKMRAKHARWHALNFVCFVVFFCLKKVGHLFVCFHFFFLRHNSTEKIMKFAQNPKIYNLKSFHYTKKKIQLDLV